MPPSKRIYTLVDFAKDLDWKPLHFVKPLPKNRRCSLCRLVRKATTILPCRHVVCSCCYDHCEAEDGIRRHMKAEKRFMVMLMLICTSAPHVFLYNDAFLAQSTS
ncbi:hypothetical protein HPB50_010849 [Hyalomma asiaticum]|uniref:Uncharacterized protein n=1 Tax=Hyalomma asiaticum TaxID=266040 RepID=A0ACB7RQG6_HYAAI|nr:hypothetical protein HPB50_010849 [Hyalomma asiaticum]